MKTKTEKLESKVAHLIKRNQECADRSALQSGIDAAEFVSINKQLMKAERELKNAKRAS